MERGVVNLRPGKGGEHMQDIVTGSWKYFTFIPNSLKRFNIFEQTPSTGLTNIKAKSWQKSKKAKRLAKAKVEQRSSNCQVEAL